MSSPIARRLFRERCQFENPIYNYTPPFGELRALKRAAQRFVGPFAKRAGEGKASKFAAGDFVRVRDAEAIRATLDEHDALRGLVFTPAQWESCGKTFRIETVVRRMMDDVGRMRAISRTVALENVMCDGPHGDHGCGRACPLLFRDEWLEPSAPELAEKPVYPRYARVKPADEILATLDRNGLRDGLMFAPEMTRYAGGRFPVYKRVTHASTTAWRRASAETYVLAGVRCLGESLGRDGPCHRGCGLLWHKDWLEFD
ncbi:MAG TPA: hypothetical protein VGC96_12065 [Candidatus Elarobacter sp.]|jgi:hypothetical protein